MLALGMTAAALLPTASGLASAVPAPVRGRAAVLGRGKLTVVTMNYGALSVTCGRCGDGVTVDRVCGTGAKHAHDEVGRVHDTSSYEAHAVTDAHAEASEDGKKKKSSGCCGCCPAGCPCCAAGCSCSC